MMQASAFSPLCYFGHVLRNLVSYHAICATLADIEEEAPKYADGLEVSVYVRMKYVSSICSLDAFTQQSVAK